VAEPITWKTSKSIFVNSMSDLFQDKIPIPYIEHVARIMEMADWHTYQVLTKRAERMRDLLKGPLSFVGERRHIWWGVSVEDRKYGLPRIEVLRETRAALRFLSIEPLLEDLGDVNLDGIHWVIVGGESGHGARELKKEWVLSLREQCDAAGVPFFFKQWGGERKSVKGRLLDGRTYDAMPERRAAAVPSHSSRARMLSNVRDREEEYRSANATSRDAALQSLLF
jgi:protein gp37